MTDDLYRGHPIVLTGPNIWVYADTSQLVSEDPQRPCGHCGVADTPEGHDGCLGTLPGVMNACCGHGEQYMAYIQYPDGSIVSGIEAATLMKMRILKCREDDCDEPQVAYGQCRGHRYYECCGAVRGTSHERNDDFPDQCPEVWEE